MSYQLMAWASEQVTGSPTRKAVLMALANAANHHTGRCDPSVAQIAAETELSEPTVKRALADLAKEGFVERKRKRRGDGSLGTYAFSFPHTRDQSDPARDHSDPSLEITETPRPEITVIPLNQEEDLEPGSEPGSALALRAVYDPRKGTKIDGRNLPFDALVTATQADERAEGGKIGTALKKIRAISAEDIGSDPRPQDLDDALAAEWFERQIAAEITARAAMYRARWPQVELTPTALASNWVRVTTAPPGGNLDSALEAAQRGIDSARRTA